MESSPSGSRSVEDVGAAPGVLNLARTTTTTATTTRSHPALEVSELRAGLQQQFRQNGTLQHLKTQLRGSVLTELMRKQKAAALSPAHRQAARGKRSDDADDDDDAMDVTSFEAHRDAQGQSKAESGGAAAASSLANWAGRVSDALVENHLRRTRRPMSLSIFSTEAEVAPFSTSGVPSEDEQNLSRLLHCAANADATVDTDGVEPARQGQGIGKSLLQQLVEARLLETDAATAAASASHRHSCSTQTDDTTQTDATNPLTSMECRLAAVDAKYALTFSQLRQNGAEQNSAFFTRSEVERRLQQYRQDIREQLTSEFQAKYRAFEQGKLQEAKAEHEARYQNLVQIKTDEWRETERSLVVKVEQERKRLTLAREDVERQKLALERRHRETSDLLHDHEVAQDDLRSQLRDAKEKCRLLQLHASKWEELCGSRLVELEAGKSREVRRIEDMQRMQAEFAAELRLKEEDIARLRFRVRTLINHAGGTRAGDGARSDGPSAATPGAASASDRMQEDLYNVLVRTEELQRNAVRQQQQSWEHAWNARTAEPTQPPPPPPPTFGASQPAPMTAATTQPQQKAQGRVVAAKSSSHASPTPVALSPIQPTTTRLSSAEASSSPSQSRTVDVTVETSQTRLAPSAGETKSPLLGSPGVAQSGSRRSTHGSPLVATAAVVQEPSQPSSSSPPRSSASSTPAKAAEGTAAAAAATSVHSSVATSSRTSSAVSSPKPTGAAGAAATSTGASSPSDASSPVHSDGEAESEPAPAEEDAAAAAIAALVEEEQDVRVGVENEEESARAGVQWSESSQRDVLRSQEAERDQESRGGGRALGFVDQLEQQRAQEDLQRDNIIYRDDEEDDDSILFGGKSDDTDQSF